MSLLDSFWTKTNEVLNNNIGNTMGLITTPIKNVFSNIASSTTSGNTGGSTDPSLQNRKYTVRIYQNQNVIVGAVPETVELNQSATWNAPWAGGISGTKGDLMALTFGTRLVAQVLTLQVWQGGGNNDLDFSIQFEFRAYSDPEQDVMVPLRTLLAMTMPSLSTNGFLKAPGPQITKEGLKSLGAGAAAVMSTTGELGVSALKYAGGVSSGKMAAGDLVSLSESASSAVDKIGATAQKNGISRKAIEDKMENKIKIEIGDWFRMSNVVITDVRHTFKSQRPGQQSGTLLGADVTVSFRPMFAMTAEDVDNLIGGGVV